jgi:hypothetical protein
MIEYRPGEPPVPTITPTLAAETLTPETPTVKNLAAGAITPQHLTNTSETPGIDQVVSIEQTRLPSFFFIGPPRTGSSWLYDILSSHALLPTPSKETRFFDVHYHRGLKWYIAHYQSTDGKRQMGEVAPTYFSSTKARERIAEEIPGAKIICVFRHPVERIVSLYRLKRAYGHIPEWTFEEALEQDPELVETSVYASNLRLWQRSFGAANIWAGIYDDLQANPQAFMNSIADFVGLCRFNLVNHQRKPVHDSDSMTQPKNYYRTRCALLMADWFKARRLNWMVVAAKRSWVGRRLVLGGGAPFAPPRSEVLRSLSEKLQPEVDAMESLLQRDLSSWRLPSRNLYR